MSCWSDFEGTWSYKDMIGSKVRLKSVSLSYVGKLRKDSSFRFAGAEMTIKDIYYRVNTEGKIIPLFRMEEVCGKLFLGRDLEVLSLSEPSSSESRICGKFSTGPKNLVEEEIITEEDNNLNISILSEEENNSPKVRTFERKVISEAEDENIIIEDSEEDNDINNWKVIML